MSKQTCQWEIHNSGDIEIDFHELVGMTEEEVEDYLYESVDIEVRDQAGYNTTLRWDRKEVMRQLREYEKEQEDYDPEEV